MKTIYLAGGCFWGSEKYFESLKGVIFTEVGYANGNTVNPTYHDLKDGKATHAETVKVIYDEKTISLIQLIEHLFRFIDPFSVDRQGEDYGHQYRTGIFYDDEESGRIAEAFVKDKEKEAGRKLALTVESLKNFYPAEEYHQKYLDKNPNGYCQVNLHLIKPEEKK